MPADDLVLNVRQIAGYSPVGSAPPTAALLMQLAGLGSAYASISPEALVGTALAQGGSMSIGGLLEVVALSGGSAVFSNGTFSLLGAQKACISNLVAQFGTLGGVQIATVDDIAALAATTVMQFNGRTGFVVLQIDDILNVGGAPIFSPVFQGSPQASTPSLASNSNRLATTAFVQALVAATYEEFAPLDSPAFTGIPTAPTASPGSSTGQLATTAFVQDAITESTTGVASFNTRTGAVTLTASDVTSVGGALLASPAFTGLPSAPTAAPSTNTTQLATTQFVQAAVTAVAGGVSSFNTRTGAVMLTAADVAAVGVSAFNGRLGSITLLANDVSAAGGAMVNSPAFTGVPTAPTAALGVSTTQLATTAFVAAAITSVSAVSSFNGRGGAVVLTTADVTGVGAALLASPIFTGSPQAPTAIAGTATAQLATCAFVQAAITASTGGVASFNGRTGAVTLLAADISAAGGAPLNGPAFTGIPTAPTASPGTSTNQLATTAFVAAAISAVSIPAASSANPLVNGTAAPGSSGAYSRGDHVHPTDTSLLPLTGGTLTGGLIVNAGGVRVNNGASMAVSGASGVDRIIFGQTGALNRWGLDLGTSQAETGGSAGSNFNLISYGDGGGVAFIPISIVRNTGVTTFSSAIVNGPSDRSLKENVEPLAGSLDRVLELQGVSFNLIGQPTAKREIGLIAQDVEPIVPEIIQPFQTFDSAGRLAANKLALDYPKLTALLIEAVKELAARVVALEAA